MRYKQNLSVDNDKVYSYGTHVATIQGRKLYQLGYWSTTTQKHINYVAREYGLKLVKDKEKIPASAKAKKEEKGDSMLKTCAMIAAMGDIFGNTQKEKTDWKQRFISKVPGIIMPDDFDSLPEAEKQRRLDGAISVGLNNEVEK